MSYIDENLIIGESVLYRASLHWIIFRWSVVWLIVAVSLLDGNSQFIDASVMFFVIAVLTATFSYINYKTSEFGITNKRVIVKQGFIRRDTLEVLLSKIESVQVKQGLLGRALGYGTIVITGTGGIREPFKDINSPLIFRRTAQEQIAVAQEVR